MEKVYFVENRKLYKYGTISIVSLTSANILPNNSLGYITLALSLVMILFTFILKVKLDCRRDLAESYLVDYSIIRHKRGRVTLERGLELFGGHR